MENMGADVGQKMKCAIKAKLVELDCYVDDELPDYIMVMVANKRSKSQMLEDLNLFLASKTAVFVEWLYIVLKKLKEVTVTNPDVYKKVAKTRLSNPSPPPHEDEKNSKWNSAVDRKPQYEKNLTDDLPILSSNLIDRKAILLKEEKVLKPVLQEGHSTTENNENSSKPLMKDRIVLLSESDATKNVDEENMNDNAQENAEVDLHPNNSSRETEDISQTDETTTKNDRSTNKRKHSPIVFKDRVVISRLSVRDRLGEKQNSPPRNSKRTQSDSNEDEENVSNGIYSAVSPKRLKKTLPSKLEINMNQIRNISLENLRLQNSESKKKIMSKIHIPKPLHRSILEEESEKKLKSVVHVKPRKIPKNVHQPNKNLLLKAVAEAQKSIIQSAKPKNTLLAKSARDFEMDSDSKSHKFQSIRDETMRHVESNVPRAMLPEMAYDEDGFETTDDTYTPMSVCDDEISEEIVNYLPSSKYQQEDDQIIGKNIITRNRGNESLKSKYYEHDDRQRQVLVQRVLKTKCSPSPIIFDKVITKPRVSNPLGKVSNFHSLPIRTIEQCKYWPNCRLGNKCEFTHPAKNCEAFPLCPFGQNCYYIHPKCKFGNSCTKLKCPFNHSISPKYAGSRAHKDISNNLQICKYFPNCTKPGCPFYHRKPSTAKASNLTWRPH